MKGNEDDSGGILKWDENSIRKGLYPGKTTLHHGLL